MSITARFAREPIQRDGQEHAVTLTSHEDGWRMTCSSLGLEAYGEGPKDAERAFYALGSSEPRRGESEVKAFAEAMIQKLSEPQNVEKGDWRNVQRGDLLSALIHEIAELTEEIAYSYPEPDDVRAEALDVAVYAMMLASWTDYHWSGEGRG